MAEHTKGPWEITEQSGDFEGGFRGVVGPMQTNSLGKEYRLYVAQYVEPKNASLVSAAPDLLAALEALTRCGRKQGWHSGGYSEEMDAAAAAISKATS